jgi:hypothetical protein
VFGDVPEAKSSEALSLAGQNSGLSADIDEIGVRDAARPGNLDHLQPMKFDSISADLGQIVVRRNPQRSGGVRYGQAQRFNTLAQHKSARVRWILHRHGFCYLSVVIGVVDIQRVALGKTENHPPVGANRHRPIAL